MKRIARVTALAPQVFFSKLAAIQKTQSPVDNAEPHVLAFARSAAARAHRQLVIPGLMGYVLPSQQQLSIIGQGHAQP